jgi:hypothetical protein
VGQADDIAARLRRFVSEQSLSVERRALALDAIDAFVSFDARQELASLEPLAAAASSTNKAVYEVGAQLLALLARRFDAARDRWRVLATSRSATARFHAIAYLDGQMPEAFLLEVLRLGLADRATRVRAKSVEVTEAFELRELLPDLERLATEEKAEAVLEALADYLPMLRDGYALSPDHKWVQFRLPGAFVSAPLHGPATAAAIAEVIAEERRKRQ